MLNARRTLNRARLFRDEAEKEKSGDRERLAAFFESAIVFGRSVTLHLQKELKGENGFAEWYETKREEMGNDLFKFFRDTRNFVLKEGPAGIKKHITMILEPGVYAIVGLEVGVTRSTLWHRRRPAILWEDTHRWFDRHATRFKRKIREPWERWQRQRAAKRAVTKSTVTARFAFDGSPFPDRDAFDLLDEYLEKLDGIVAAAEARWDG